MLSSIGPELFQISDHKNWSRNRLMLCSLGNLTPMVSLAVENREAVGTSVSVQEINVDADI